MRKVLIIIEDELPLCWLLKKMLNRTYEIVVINDAVEASGWFYDQNTCDLIICDLDFASPAGAQLLKNLSGSALYANIPVVVLSAPNEPRELLAELKIVWYLLKPFSPNAFLQDLRAFLG